MPLNGWEIPLLVLLALLFFGGKKLPEFARGLGESIRITKKEIQGVNDDIDEIKGEVDEVKEAASIKTASTKKTTKKSKTKKS